MVTRANDLQKTLCGEFCVPWWILETYPPIRHVPAAPCYVPAQQPSAAGQLVRRAARAELRLQRGQLGFDVGVRARLVEFLLDVVGVAAHVLEHAGLQQLVERARARLHLGDLVL